MPEHNAEFDRERGDAAEQERLERETAERVAETEKAVRRFGETPYVSLAKVRLIARDEIASLAGLMLRRLQDVDMDGSTFVLVTDLQSIFGEVLRTYGTSEVPDGS